MATKTNISKTVKKRTGGHHRHSKEYKHVYWPYLPLMLASVLLLIVSFMPRQTKGSTLAYATGLSPANLLNATNHERTRDKKTALELNVQLSQAAQAKAQDMVTRNYWSHKTPDGKDPWVFIDQAGYQYTKAGENLAYGFLNSADTVNGWMNSTSHRDNMLDENYTQVGFGYANAPDFLGKGEETIVVALYARPLGLGLATGVNEEPAPTAVQPAKAVTKAEALFGSNLAWAPFSIGVVSGAAAMGLLVNHGLRLHRFIRKSKRHFVAHPVLDVSLLLIAVSCLELSRTVGFIR